MSYKMVAVSAATLAKEKNMQPYDAWQYAVKEAYPNSKESQKKSCPRNAFLGLCSSGKVKGIPKDKYTSSSLNKQYAMEALYILSVNPHSSFSAAEMWRYVLADLGANKNKRLNGQMQVVLALWENDFLIKVS